MEEGGEWVEQGENFREFWAEEITQREERYKHVCVLRKWWKEKIDSCNMAGMREQQREISQKNFEKEADNKINSVLY